MYNKSVHFKEMLVERRISEQWIKDTLESPDMREDESGEITHYIKKIPEYGNRWLRVIVNTRSIPPKLITAFFDRRLRRLDHEN